MTAMTITRALLRSWWVLATCAVLGALVAALSSAAMTPTYRASTSYYVSVAGQDASSAGEIASGSTAAQQKIKSYVQLASSPRVLTQVIDQLHLKTTPAELGKRVSASVGTGTVIISITVTNTDAADAARVTDAIGTTLASVVSQIEPEVSAKTPSVRLEEITPAAVPTSPVGPRTTANTALGIMAGLGIGAALALLRTALDTRIRTADDLDDLGLPLLGDIAFDSDAAAHPLIVRDHAGSARSEAFRALRTNVQFLRSDGPRTLVVTSARPSEGKTTTTANLAVAMSQSGLRVAVVDADLRRPNLANVMGVEGAAGLSDLLVGRAELEDVLQEWGEDGLHVLPAGTIPPNPSELLGSEAMERVLDVLTDRFDVVLLDTPPVLAVTDASILSALVPTTLLVSAAGQTKRTEVRLATEALDRVGRQASGVVLTKTKHARRQGGYYRSEYAAVTTPSA